MRPHALFSSGLLDQWLKSRGQKALAAIDDVPEAEILGLDVAAFTDDLVDRFAVTPVELGEPEIDDLGEAKVDVSQDRRRWIDDRSQPFYVTGYRVAIHVPVLTGDAEIFDLRPNTFNHSPPQATVGSSGSITRTMHVPDGRHVDIGAEAAELRRDLDQWLGWGLPLIEAFNRALPAQIGAAISARRERIMARKDVLARTGLPVRHRPDAPRTYQAPGITRRPSPTTVRRSESSAKPAAPLEPVMVDGFTSTSARLSAPRPGASSAHERPSRV